jgi:hypothetical protein
VPVPRDDVGDLRLMSPDFVRYSPDIETVDRDIDDLLAQVIAWWENKTRESPQTEGTGRAVRPAHAKSYGFLEADVEFLDDVPIAYAQGISGKPGRHGAVIRFSSANGHLGADALLGGLSAWRSRSSTSRAPRYSRTSRTRTPSPRAQEQPIFLAKSTICSSRRSSTTPRATWRRQGRVPRAPNRFPHRQRHARAVRGAWDELFAFVRLAQTPATNPLLTPYCTMGAVRNRDYIAKVPVAPAAESAAQAIHRELDLTQWTGRFPARAGG